MTKPDLVRAHAVVTGRVQGVGFRASTCAAADSYGVNGWVRNLIDGRVEFVAEGTRESVQALVEWSRVGPSYAQVTDVNVSWEPTRNEPGGFRIG